jgi:hypothetical protein
MAASATFALNATLCFFRVLFMSCSRATGAFWGQGSTLAYGLIFAVHLNTQLARLPTRVDLARASARGHFHDDDADNARGFVVYLAIDTSRSSMPV